MSRKNVDGEILPYTKTRTNRAIDLDEPLAEDLAGWAAHLRRETGLLFTRRDGAPLRETDYRNWRRRYFEPAALAVGLSDPRPYELRATWVSLMIYEWHTVVEVAKRAGHTPETCLRHYARVFEEYDPADRIAAAEQIRRARRELELERLNGVQQELPGL